MREFSPKSKCHQGLVIVFTVIAAFIHAPSQMGTPLCAQEADRAALDQPEPDQQTQTSASAEDLLKQLDSPLFKDREAATDRLVELGPDILKQLIVHFFDSSSEAGWRIHRVLEGIGQNSSEEDFLKSMAIIQVLYGAQDDQSQQRLAKLQFQWKLTRRQEAAQKLAKQGFKFDGMLEAQAGLERDLEIDRIARIELMVRAAEGGIHIATGPETDQPITKKIPDHQWTNPRVQRQQSIVKIEKIIAGDAESNRQIVDSLLPSSFNATLPPGFLQFPENWEPNEESIQLIKELSALSSLTFRNQRINEKLCEFLSKQEKLQGLQLINCQFDDGRDGEEACELKLPKSITNLIIDGTLPPAESISSLGHIGTLRLAGVELNDKFSTALSRCNVQTLDLEEVKFDRKNIRRLVNIRGLFRVTVSMCSFDLEWLEDARKRNPNLISASPKAFLGVQGPIDISGRELNGCQISQVVEDTAAADAGMQSLDVVTAMDGTKINRFEDLRLLISQKRPGDSMDLEVQRGDKRLNLKVKLGDIGESTR